MKTRAAVAWKAGARLTIEEVDLDGPRAGKPLLRWMGTSTCANPIVVPGIALAKIWPDAPFDKVRSIGCGVTTGAGALKVSPCSADKS